MNFELQELVQAMVVESGIFVQILWWLHILAVQLEMLLNLNCLGRAPARGFLAGTESKDSFEVDHCELMPTLWVHPHFVRSLLGPLHGSCSPLPSIPCAPTPYPALMKLFFF